MKATVFCVGINDSNYVTQKFTKINGKQKLTWICPYYQTWYSMIRRCYSEVVHKNRPTYIGCSVVDEWKYFMNFRSWMIQQDWEGNHLDKDILVKDNKLYSPDTCVFVSQSVNSFLNSHSGARGDYPIGVHFHKRDKVFTATINNGYGKFLHLGYFNCPEIAHQAWLTKKREIAKIIASEQSNILVAKALIDRFNVEKYDG